MVGQELGVGEGKASEAASEAVKGDHWYVVKPSGKLQAHHVLQQLGGYQVVHTSTIVCTILLSDTLFLVRCTNWTPAAFQ